ncbi:hypothetical protein MPSEU_000209200 [Mayamaea pseudoterrestris]|nr:hypothetical protein MPSEU_000209200 [Mayamaea pseudoterrestris]
MVMGFIAAINAVNSTCVAKEKDCDGRYNNSALSVRVVSGSIGSIITALVVTPLEVVKVRLQATVTDATRSRHVVRCSQGCGTFVLTNFAGQTQLLPRSQLPFFDHRSGSLTERAKRACDGSDGVIKTLRRIYRAEGLSGIYAGLRPTLVMAVPNTVIYFTSYESISCRLHDLELSHSVAPTWYPTGSAIPILAGGSARMLASSVTAPFEYMRTRQALMEGTNQPHQGLWKDMTKVVRDEGFGGLYKGFRPTLWRDVPFSAIYWLCLERLRDVWKDKGYRRPTTLEQAMQAFVNGFVSGVIAAACTTPFDVIKSRQQQEVTEIFNEGVSESAALLCKHDGAIAISSTTYPRSAGMFAQLRHIALTEGAAGLWRGNWTRMLKVAPSCALMITSYEVGKRLLE